jgi:SAM-dependent methyltransferase
VADRLDPGVFLTETRAFFAPRAATWEQRFPDDDPAYAAAVAELRLRPGQTALDVGCGTGLAELARYDDDPDHFLAIADRVPGPSDKDP